MANKTMLLDLILTWTRIVTIIVVPARILRARNNTSWFDFNLDTTYWHHHRSIHDYLSFIDCHLSFINCLFIVYSSFIHRLLIMVCLLFAYGSWFNVVAINWYIIIFYNYATYSHRSLARRRAGAYARSRMFCMWGGVRSPLACWEENARVIDDLFNVGWSCGYVRTYSTGTYVGSSV